MSVSEPKPTSTASAPNNSDLLSVDLSEMEHGTIQTQKKDPTTLPYLQSDSETNMSTITSHFRDAELETAFQQNEEGPSESHGKRLVSLRGVYATLLGASVLHFLLHSLVFDSLHPNTSIPKHVVVCGLAVGIPGAVLMAVCHIKTLQAGLWKLRQYLSPMFFLAVITGVMFNTLHHFQQYVYTTFITTVALYWFSRATDLSVKATAFTAVSTLASFLTLVVLIAKHSASEMEIDAFSTVVFVLSLVGSVIDARLFAKRRRTLFVLQCRHVSRQRDADDARSGSSGGLSSAIGFVGGMGPPRGGSPTDRLHAAAPAEMMQSPTKHRGSPSGKTLRRRSPPSTGKKNPSGVPRSILSADAPPFTMNAMFTDETVAEASFSDFPRQVAQGPPNALPLGLCNPNGGSPSSVVLTKRDTPMHAMMATVAAPATTPCESKAVVPDTREDKDQATPELQTAALALTASSTTAAAAVSSQPKQDTTEMPQEASEPAVTKTSAVPKPDFPLTVDTRPLPHHKPMSLMSCKSTSSRPPATPRVTPSSSTQSKAQLNKRQRYVNALCARGYPVDLVPVSRSVETLKMVLRGFKADVEKLGLEAAQQAARDKAAKRSARAKANNNSSKRGKATTTTTTTTTIGIRAPGATPTNNDADVAAPTTTTTEESENRPTSAASKSSENGPTPSTQRPALTAAPANSGADAPAPAGDAPAL